MNTYETIYVAALLEGEGSFMEKRHGCPRISCQMTDAVHHLDGNKHNNHPSNLQVLDSLGDHRRIHGGTR